MTITLLYITKNKLILFYIYKYLHKNVLLLYFFGIKNKRYYYLNNKSYFYTENYVTTTYSCDISKLPWNRFHERIQKYIEEYSIL